MRYDSQKKVFMMVSALVLALAAMLAGPAGARPVDTDGTAPSSSQFVPVRPDDLGGLQGTGSVGATSVTPVWLRALQLRSEALDRQYGLGKQAQDSKTNSGWYTGLEQTDLPSATTTPQSDDGFFDPSGTTIGGAAAIVALLLGGMALLYSRGRHGGKLAT